MAVTTIPLHLSVHVPVEPARAFDLFMNTVRDWRDARVVSFVPASRIVVDSHPNGVSTTLEVLFDGPAPRRTNVTLIHRGLEDSGQEALWSDRLERFAALVKRQPSVEPKSVTDGETILATIDVPTTPERVFRALTTNDVERWWGAPDTYQATAWLSDTRVGGRWSVLIRLPDGSEFPASGQYLAIDAPRRIVQTRRYDWDYPDLGRRDTTVTYLLEPIEAGTRVTVRQDGFAGLRGAADHHVEGWVGFLRYLASYLSHEVPGHA